MSSSTEQIDTKDIENANNAPNPSEERAGYKYIQEGLASMYCKIHENNGGEEIFYNPVQMPNRDLSILMISLFAERKAKRDAEKKLKKWTRQKQKEHENKPNNNEFPTKTVDDFIKEEFQGLRVLDALAASGLRSIRYIKECYSGLKSMENKNLISEIIVNDLDPAAVDQAHENVKFNNVDPKIVKPQQGDAMDVMYSVRSKPDHEKFDVIDLDPYGSAAPFLDAAVQSVSNGGLLCVSSTDMIVLGGSKVDTCFGRYRSMPMPKAGYLQELALRILLQTIESRANTYGRTIKPILCVGMAFYVRVFVEIHDDRAGVVSSSLRIGHVYQSTQCPSFFTVPQGIQKKNVFVPSRGPPSPVCEETGASFKIAGPIWLGCLHDPQIVKGM